MADETPEDTGTATIDAPAPEAADKLTQEVEISDAGPCKKHVKVTVDRAAIDARMNEKFSTLVLNTPAQIDGFRPGKAPRKIIEKRFGKEVASEVKTEVLMASLEQLAEQDKLSPLSPPELDPNAVVIPETGPLVYEFDIEVRPEFNLPDYKGLKIRRPVQTFTDTDVEKESRRMLEPYGQIVPKEGPVADDDVVVADVTITRDGQELNKISEVRVKVEDRLALSDGVVEGFAEKMRGAVPGDSRTVDVTLGQSVAESLRGVNVQAAFAVKDVKTVRLPELTPELLEEFGVRTPDAFSELVRTRLDRILDYAQRQAARQQVFEQLAAAADWDLPRDLLIRQARKTMSRKVMEMRSAGMTEEQIAGRQRVLEMDAIKSTAAALKEHFVLQKIAEVEKIEIEDSDIDEEIDAIADRTNESPRKVRARLEKDDLIEPLATELLERKALDLVLSSAVYEDVPLQANDATASGDVATVEASAVPPAEGEAAGG